MHRYRKAPDRDIVIIPEFGRVPPGVILEGPQFERFATAGLLERIEAPPPPSPVSEPVKGKRERPKAFAEAPPPPPPPEPEPVPEPAVNPEPEIPEVVEAETEPEDAPTIDPEPSISDPEPLPDDAIQAKMARRAAIRQKGHKP